MDNDTQLLTKFQCVLLIDDDPVSIFLSKRVIKSMDVAQYIAVMHNEADALAFLVNKVKIGEVFPEAIIMDINLSGADIYSFLDRFNSLKYDGPKPILAALSNSTHEKDRNNCQSYGIKYFLEKPLTREKMQQVLS